MKVKEIRELCTEFVLPAILLVGCLGLLYLKIDGEVKVILTMAGTWMFKSVVDKRKK